MKEKGQREGLVAVGDVGPRRSFRRRERIKLAVGRETGHNGLGGGKNSWMGQGPSLGQTGVNGWGGWPLRPTGLQRECRSGWKLKA